MKIFKHFLFQFIVVFPLLIVVHAQNQTGFISLDCGRLPKNASYTEPTIGINYVSDEPYIDSGESKSIQTEYKAVLQEQASFVRAFPEGIRNCYRIGVPKNTKYLIRGSFVYGNYDGLNQLPEFDLYLGVSFWSTVKIEYVDFDVQKEMVHVAQQDFVRVCLVNTGLGTPFISALELRPLSNASYVTPSVSLSLVLRADILGSTSNGSVYRYPYDVYDRLWQPFNNDYWAQLTTSRSVLTGANFQLAPIVMATAATPINETSPLQFFWTNPNPDVVYYVYMCFAELQQLGANESRAFNIMWNGQLFYGPLVPNYLNTTIIQTPSGISGGNFTFSLVRLENSTLPPIINAIEIFTAVDVSQSETDSNDVDGITKIKSSYGLKRNWEGDPCLPLEYSWTGLNCSFDGLEPPRIISLNLSSSGLSGEISPYISNLTLIESLDLSNNNLTGSVPDFLSQLPNLRILNLERNKLTGSLPAELIKKSENGLLSLSVGENPNLCSTVSCERTETTKKTKKNNVLIPIAASVGGSVVLVLIIGAAIFAILKWKRPVQFRDGNDSLESKKRQFTYSEVLKITRNFERTLGKGGFGTVYLGFVDENTRVAVKMLSHPQAVQGSQIEEQLSQQSFYHQQFQAEVKLLMRVHHTNLTSLVGYCNEGDNKALIYEFMENGDLESHILGDGNANVLSWEKRLQIAIDSAQGLEYLHNGCKPPIIHRDVKTTNILLNERLQAKIADFGLSKALPSDDNVTHVLTRVAGTRGYLDPEYYSTNRLNEKSDVYSFGVVLLEIITGRPAISRAQDRTHVIQWVNSMLSNGDIKSIVEPKLRGNFEANSVWKAVELATACVSRAPSRRPTMSQVVTELKDCLAAESSRRNNSHLTASPTDSVGLLSAGGVNMATELSPVAR